MALPQRAGKPYQANGFNMSKHTYITVEKLGRELSITVRVGKKTVIDGVCEGSDARYLWRDLNKWVRSNTRSSKAAKPPKFKNAKYFE